MPALVDGAGIDRDDVAVAEGVAVGDSMDDRRVRRRADDGREAVVPEERGSAPALTQHLRRDRIQLDLILRR